MLGREAPVVLLDEAWRCRHSTGATGVGYPALLSNNARCCLEPARVAGTSPAVSTSFTTWCFQLWVACMPQSPASARSFGCFSSLGNRLRGRALGTRSCNALSLKTLFSCPPSVLGCCCPPYDSAEAAEGCTSQHWCWSSTQPMLLTSLPGVSCSTCADLLLCCAVPCRWLNQLNPDVKKGPFTPEEDAAIMAAHNIFGNKWASIAKLLPGRCVCDLTAHMLPCCWTVLHGRQCAPALARAQAGAACRNAISQSVARQAVLGA
jgi:hypothetical protein